MKERRQGQPNAPLASKACNAKRAQRVEHAQRAKRTCCIASAQDTASNASWNAMVKESPSVVTSKPQYLE